MFDGKHILVVDDDPDICDAIGEYLELRRFRVSLARGGDDMQEIMQDDPADLVLLDVGLPGIDGIQLARKLHATYACGIIMVTGHGDPEDRVLGLETGADDYVVKPFSFRELLARINSVLRRLEPLSDQSTTASRQVIHFGDWTFDLTERVLLDKEGNSPDLSTGELDILTILANKANKPVSRHELLEDSSHRDWNPLDRSIDVRITRLRKKLEADPSNPKIIRTARNIGYILRADTDVGIDGS
jgi:DNA-binding response OmpR family regulator